MRIVKVAAMLSGIVVATFVVRQVLGAVSGGRLSWLASPATTVAALLPFAARVGFRRRDTLWLVVPIVGLFWLYRMLWRVASLPDRYWERSKDRRSRQPDSSTQPAGVPQTLDPPVGQAQPPMGGKDGDESAPPSSGGDLAQLRNLTADWLAAAMQVVVPRLFTVAARRILRAGRTGRPDAIGGSASGTDDTARPQIQPRSGRTGHRLDRRRRHDRGGD